LLRKRKRDRKKKSRREKELHFNVQKELYVSEQLRAKKEEADHSYRRGASRFRENLRRQSRTFTTAKSLLKKCEHLHLRGGPQHNRSSSITRGGTIWEGSIITFAGEKKNHTESRKDYFLL